MELSRKIRDGFPAFCAYNHLKDITDEINKIRYFISYKSYFYMNLSIINVLYYYQGQERRHNIYGETRNVYETHTTVYRNGPN